jgi:HSP20 family protein
MSSATLAKQEHRGSGQVEATRGASFTPRVDICETEHELTLFADMPGVGAEDVNVHFENGELTVHGRCPARHDSKDFLLQEYGVGDFFRAFTISEHVDSDRIAAELKNGVLTLHLPKSEKVKPKRIAVKGS